MRQFKALYNYDYSVCRDERHLYEEWEEVFRARPKYISIMPGLVTEEDEQETNNEENDYDDGADKDGIFSGVSPVDGISLLAHVLSGRGGPILEVQGKSVCVSCLDFSYNCLNKKIAQRWYAYQVRTNQVPWFPLRTDLNDLEVHHQWD